MSTPPLINHSKTDSAGRAARRMLSLAAGIAVLGTGVFSARADDIADLKAQVAALQSKVNTLETKGVLGVPMTEAHTASADGKDVYDKTPVADLPPLESFTRNFEFKAYMRAGVSFTGDGRGQDTSFQIPENYGGRMRLGNENDTYMELSYIQKHILGDDPDKMDVMFKVTPAIVNGSDKYGGVFSSAKGWDIGLQEAFIEFKNVFKSAPEVTFWGGQRFYDRYNIDSNDYFWLSDSGYGVGVYNIDLGFGKLAIAYFGGNNSLVNGGEYTTGDNGVDDGPFYKHTLDIRIGDIDFLTGKLKLVFLANYIKGGRFNFSDGGTADLEDAWGLGGGAIWEKQFGGGTFLQIAALYGHGATNFESGLDTGRIAGIYNYTNELIAHGLAPYPNDGVVNIDPFEDANRVRVNFQYILNATSNFSLGFWGVWQYDDQGYNGWGYKTDDLGFNAFVQTSGETNTFGVGLRPIFWIAQNIAIQGQLGYQYVDNTRTDSGGAGQAGASGGMGIFTIAPTLKSKDPKNGSFFTRPELRIFATYAVWDDELKGYIGSGTYGDENQGWTFGTQVEIWW